MRFGHQLQEPTARRHFAARRDHWVPVNDGNLCDSTTPTLGSAPPKLLPGSQDLRYVPSFTPTSSSDFEPRQSSSAGSESVGLQSQTLQHTDKEITEWRRILRIECKVLSVPEPPPANRTGRFLVE